MQKNNATKKNEKNANNGQREKNAAIKAEHTRIMSATT